jgi:hypothetical protein
MIDVLTYFTLNSLAYFAGYFSGNYGMATTWIFGFHTMWCLTFGDLVGMTVGTAPRDIIFTKAWGFYLINIFVWAWGGANLRSVMRGVRFMDGRQLKEEKLHDAKRYSLMAIIVFFVYFLLFAASFIPFELKIIGVEPLGGFITLAAMVIVTFVFYAVALRDKKYYPDSKVLRMQLTYFLLMLLIYGATFVILDAIDFTYSMFDQWHTLNLNCWISLGFGGVALIIYPLALDRLLPPVSKPTPSDTKPEKDTEALIAPVQSSSLAARYIRLE